MIDKLIFFVDDESTFINLLEYTFKCRNGYTTRTFSTAAECIQHLPMKPDLIVIDFFLRGTDSQMTGLDLAKVIKQTDPGISIVILSGNDDAQVISEAKAIGVEQYIIKDGYFIDNLVECISNILPVEPA